MVNHGRMTAALPRSAVEGGFGISVLFMVLVVNCSPEKQSVSSSVKGQAGNKSKVADNSYCYVCHINYQQEEFNLEHKRVGIGCVTCHGESPEHSSDEDGITPPEIMYVKTKVNPSCMKCHARDDIRKNNVHKAVFSEIAAQEKYCTDCHGKHRLEVRTRRWNKETGELVADDGVRVESKALEQKQK